MTQIKNRPVIGIGPISRMVMMARTRRQRMRMFSPGFMMALVDIETAKRKHNLDRVQALILIDYIIDC